MDNLRSSTTYDNPSASHTTIQPSAQAVDYSIQMLREIYNPASNFQDALWRKSCIRLYKSCNYNSHTETQPHNYYWKWLRLQNRRTSHVCVTWAIRTIPLCIMINVHDQDIRIRPLSTKKVDKKLEQTTRKGHFNISDQVFRLESRFDNARSASVCSEPLRIRMIEFRTTNDTTFKDHQSRYAHQQFQDTRNSLLTISGDVEQRQRDERDEGILAAGTALRHRYVATTTAKVGPCLSTLLTVSDCECRFSIHGIITYIRPSCPTNSHLIDVFVFILSTSLGRRLISAKNTLSPTYRHEHIHG